MGRVEVWRCLGRCVPVEVRSNKGPAGVSCRHFVLLANPCCQLARGCMINCVCRLCLFVYYNSMYILLTIILRVNYYLFINHFFISEVTLFILIVLSDVCGVPCVCVID